MIDPALPSEESAAFVAELVAVTRSQLPLAEGLRAAAAETEHRRVGKALRQVATQVEAGQKLQDILAQSPQLLPGSIPKLLLAGEQGGRLGEALQDIVAHDAVTRDTLRMVRATLAYPLALLVFGYVCFVALQFILVGDMVQIYREFELVLPASTDWMAKMHTFRWWLVAAPLIALAAWLLVSRCFLRRSQRERVLATVPLLGPLWHWCGVAQATRALAHLLTQRVQLAEALRVSSLGLRDANVAEVWNKLANQVEQGIPLSRAMLNTYRLPASIAPLVYWGERTSSLPEALLAISDMLEGRIRLRAQLIRTIAPPVLFVVIGGGIYFIIFSMISPLIVLIQNLSG